VCDRQGGGETGEVREYWERHGVAISKIASRIKAFKFCLLNVCNREYGI
jgi:hypothetical protein